MKKINQYFKDRLNLPKTLTIAAIVTIPFQFWAFFSLFEDFEAWIPIFDFWDLLGAWSYTFLFVIAEILSITLYLVIINMIVPKKLARSAYIQISFFIVLEICIALLIVHNTPTLFKSVETVFWIVLAINIITAAFVGFLPTKILNLISNISERLVTLAAFFWVFDFLSLIIILIRNIF